MSEILGLQWGDFDFGSRTVLVQRSVVGDRVDEVKTEYSKDDVPLDPRLAEVLLQWRSVSIFPEESDWVFANPVTGRPYHQESLQRSQIKRAAKLAKLGDDIGWHTFPHTYRSWLDETGAPMKVQQELMRHASDPDDNERLWAGYDTNQTPCKQSGCRPGVRPKLAGFNRNCGHCDRPVNCSRAQWGIMGTCRKRSTESKLLI